MRPSRRDALIFLGGLWVGFVLGPASVFAQAVGTVAPGVPATDSGTAAALTKFLTDIGRRIWGGERRAPEWAPLILAAVFGPAITAMLALAAGVNLANGQTVAGVVIGGLLAATGGAVLLTAMHQAGRDQSANVPPPLIGVAPEQRAQLCCLHEDCRTVRMAMTQAASGQPAVPVEAQQPVPTSPPNPPPANPPSGPGVGVVPVNPVPTPAVNVPPWQRYQQGGP